MAIIKLKCANCGKDIERYENHIKKYKTHCCSISCSNKFRLTKFKLSNEELEFIKINYGTLTATEISKRLNLNLDFIRRIIKREHLQKYKNFSSSWDNRRSWTKGELSFLTENYSNKTNKELSSILNRSIGGIQSRGRILKLKKAKEFLSLMKSGEKNYFYGKKLSIERVEAMKKFNSKPLIERIGKENYFKWRAIIAVTNKGSWESKFGEEKAKKMKENLSNKLTGIKKSPEHIENNRLSQLRHKQIFTDERRRKVSEKLLLEKNPNWKGGLSFEPYPLTFNLSFKRFIRKRDNHICIKCGKHQEKLSRILAVHHINYDKKLTIPQNCCSLCNSCNAEVNFNRKHWIKFFQSLLSERYGYKYNENCDIILEVKDGNC